MPTTPQKNAINRDTVPPGLLMAADLIARIPERKDELITYEIKRREREAILLREAHKQVSWHPMKTVKSILLYGLNGFFFAWTIGSLSSIGKLYDSVKNGQVAIPLPLLSDFTLNLNSVIPTSTPMVIAKHLPTITWQDAVVIGLGIALVAVVERTVIALIHWEKSEALTTAAKELEKEISVLRQWKNGTKKSA